MCLFGYIKHYVVLNFVQNNIFLEVKINLIIFTWITPYGL